jgi:hypothetical protein
MVLESILETGVVLAACARHYRLTIRDYKTNNVLKSQVVSRDVVELPTEMCGPLFATIIGA